MVPQARAMFFFFFCHSVIYTGFLSTVSSSFEATKNHDSYPISSFVPCRTTGRNKIVNNTLPHHVWLLRVTR